MRDAVHTDILFQQNQYVLILFLKIPSQPWAHSSVPLCSCLALGQCSSGTSDQAARRRAVWGRACQGFSPLASELILAHFTLGASWATLQTCLCLTMYLAHPDPQTDFPPAPQPCPIIITNMLMFRTTGCPAAAGAVGQALADRSCPDSPYGGWPSLLLDKSCHPDL